jgi:hypothetical protein
VCAATVCAEATARQVNTTPSSVNGKGPNSDSTTSTVHITDSRHCAGETVYDHTLVEDMHISFPIEDYREEMERKISESVA